MYKEKENKIFCFSVGKIFTVFAIYFPFFSKEYTMSMHWTNIIISIVVIIIRVIIILGFIRKEDKINKFTDILLKRACFCCVSLCFPSPRAFPEHGRASLYTFIFRYFIYLMKTRQEYSNSCSLPQTLGQIWISLRFINYSQRFIIQLSFKVLEEFLCVYALFKVFFHWNFTWLNYYKVILFVEFIIDLNFVYSGQT